MLSRTLVYDWRDFGDEDMDKYEYEIEPTQEELYNFLEYYTNGKITAEQFKYFEEEFRFDFDDIVYDDYDKEFCEYLKDIYLNEAKIAYDEELAEYNYFH